MSDQVVFVLLSKHQAICSIHGDKTEADALCARFNSHPTIDGEPDVDAPYSVESWCVS